MAHSLDFRSRPFEFQYWSLILVIAAPVSMAYAAVVGDGQPATIETPAPAVDATKYDLRYKLATGDVIRFVIPASDEF